MKLDYCRWFAALVFLAVSSPGVAHNAFASVFDRDQPVNLTGKRTRLEWMNPHTWFYIDVEIRDGRSKAGGVRNGQPLYAGT